MLEKNYLTPNEQRLWEYIKDKDIVDSELAGQIFPDMGEAWRDKALHGLHKKGCLKRAKKGLYFNPERLEDPYGIALRIREGYIGLGSALSFYKLSGYEGFGVSVMTRGFRKNTPLEGTGYTIEFIPLGKLFTGFSRQGGIYVSSVEKTLFDCFLKPAKVGFSNIAWAVCEAEPDWRGFLGFFKLTDNKALRQRAGYILRLVQTEAGKDIPEYVFRELQKGVDSPARLFGPGAGRYDREWKIQDNLGKERILPWIYGS
jgi:predicted transcriptional regulator of viral defense system